MLSRENIHRKVYLFGLFVVIIGMPSSNFLMSIGQLILLANWLFEFKFVEKLKRFWKNKAALAFSAIFWICMLGVIHTEDIGLWKKTMQIMLPVFLLPFFIANAKPLSHKEYHFLIRIFVATVIFITLLGMCSYLGVFLEKVTDPRLLSPFISQIRLSLMMDISITILIYYALKSSQLKYKLLLVIPILWLLYFLTLLESLTGLLMILVYLLLVPIYFLLGDKNKIRKRISVLVLILIPLGGIFFLYSEVKEFKYKSDLKWDELEKNTINGNRYYVDKNSYVFENGYFNGIYLSEKELGKEWQKRSDLSFDIPLESGMVIRPVLSRYMTSMGLRKDSVDFSTLTDKDILNVENGATNYLYPDKRGLDL